MYFLVILFPILLVSGCVNDILPTESGDQSAQPPLLTLSKTVTDNDYVCSFANPGDRLCASWCNNPASNCLPNPPVQYWPDLPMQYYPAATCWDDPMCDMTDYAVQPATIWFAGHSYTRRMEGMSDLGADVSGYHGGEGFLSDWLEDAPDAIERGLNREYHLYVEWLQLQSQVEGSAAAWEGIREFEYPSSEFALMQQWFQTEPACTNHGLICGPDGQAWFNDLYQQVIDIAGGKLIPVGNAFVNAYNAGVTTLHRDGSHASEQGEYLRNITIVGYFLDLDPRVMPTLDIPDAAILQQAAYDALIENPGG